jgi:hypothetical protein
LALPCVRGVDVVGVLLLWVLLVMLVLVLLGAGGDGGVLFREDAYNAGDDLGRADLLDVGCERGLGVMELSLEVAERGGS